jgi:exopolyphosphatase/guanosine-5'-triphosphate,3'-diphosphate pyrophosphatase
MTRRVAAIDCGTNSIRLLIADVLEPGRLGDVVRRMEIVRLGHGVDKTGRIDDAAMERTLAMCRTYAAQCLEHGVEATRFVATSASRDAANADVFVAGVTEAFAAFGTVPEVVSGTEEATLSFRGATGDVAASGAAAPYLVVDIGGGSTELVRGGHDGSVSAVSVDVGCVRMTERHFASDPPTADQIAAAVADIDAALDEGQARVDLAGIHTLVGVAGSVTTLTAHALRLPRYQPEVEREGPAICPGGGRQEPDERHGDGKAPGTHGPDLLRQNGTTGPLAERGLASARPRPEPQARSRSNE